MQTDRKCLVLMPFDPKYREVYDNVYRPVFKENGLHCWRVDEISRPGSITRDIIDGIVEATVVLADLTSRNANVFYELGIAHCSGNKTIMTAQSMSDVPFDIGSYRVLIYEQTISGSKKLAEMLNQAIQELLIALDRTNNPVQEALSGRSSLGKRKQEPLIKYVDLNHTAWRLRDWLSEHGVVYAEDVNKIDLEVIVNTPGIGKDSLSKFFAAVVKHDLYDDGQRLQEFLVRNRLSIFRY